MIEAIQKVASIGLNFLGGFVLIASAVWTVWLGTKFFWLMLC